ncbi:hypothetical protein GOODEAATRI_015153 [Goodea atripinnis]|uniref:Uncharacterized protein n=1 Tax=Goodea atripinnis TaxID=208336 RepID=A0ABV0NAT0_9TELE
MKRSAALCYSRASSEAVDYITQGAAFLLMGAQWDATHTSSTLKRRTLPFNHDNHPASVPVSVQIRETRDRYTESTEGGLAAAAGTRRLERGRIRFTDTRGCWQN